MFGYPVAENIVGAFVVGLIVPRQGNLAIALTEKLEDVVSIVFLPIVCVPNPSRFHTRVHPFGSTSHFLVFQPTSAYSILASFGGTRLRSAPQLTLANSVGAPSQPDLLGSTGVNLQPSGP